MIKSLGKNIILSISLLLPFTYLIGIAVTEVCAMLLIIIFFFINRDLNIYKNYFFIYLFLISFYFALNSIIQINDQDLRISSIFHFRFVLFSLSIFFLLDYLKNYTPNSKNILHKI